MNELLVKYKDVNDHSEGGYIAANMCKGRVCDLLPVIKQVDSIRLGEDWYTYCSSEFIPSDGTGFLDVLYIYVEEYVG